MPASAGEHEFREIQIRIWPQGERATVHVSTRRRRGADVVWERRLGVVGTDLPAGSDTSTAALLRLVADEIRAVADRADRK